MELLYTSLWIGIGLLSGSFFPHLLRGAWRFMMNGYDYIGWNYQYSKAFKKSVLELSFLLVISFTWPFFSRLSVVMCMLLPFFLLGVGFLVDSFHFQFWFFFRGLSPMHQAHIPFFSTKRPFPLVNDGRTFFFKRAWVMLFLFLYWDIYHNHWSCSFSSVFHVQALFCTISSFTVHDCFSWYYEMWTFSYTLYHILGDPFLSYCNL